jgi:hypothetical protein
VSDIKRIHLDTKQDGSWLEARTATSKGLNTTTHIKTSTSNWSSNWIFFRRDRPADEHSRTCTTLVQRTGQPDRQHAWQADEAYGRELMRGTAGSRPIMVGSMVRRWHPKNMKTNVNSC